MNPKVNAPKTDAFSPAISEPHLVAPSQGRSNQVKPKKTIWNGKTDIPAISKPVSMKPGTTNLKIAALVSNHASKSQETSCNSP
jgi:hypothetical protein